MGVCGSYCALRLHWYVRASGQALLRHWQWLLIAALLVPGFPVGSLLAAVARALLIIVSPQLPMLPRLFGIAVVIVVAVLWVLPQRQSILGGKFAFYAATLPVSPLANLAVDLTILLAANLLPLLLFAVAMAGAGSLSALSLLGLLAAALAAQLLLLRLGHVPTIFRRAATGARWKEALSPALLIQVQILAERKGAVFLRMAAALGIALAADRLIIAFGLDGRSLPVSTVAAAMICLLVSGLYRPLHDAHRGAAGFLTTLPLPATYWPSRDTAFVVLSGAPVLALILVWLGLQSVLSAGGLVMLALSSIALLVLLRFPVIMGGRLTIFLSALTAGLWAGAGIAAVLR